MAYYRRSRFTKKQEAYFSIVMGILMIPVGVAGCVVCIVALVSFLINLFTGKPVLESLAIGGFVYFFVGGIAYLLFLGIETLKDGLKLRKEILSEKDNNEQK